MTNSASHFPPLPRALLVPVSAWPADICNWQHRHTWAVDETAGPDLVAHGAASWDTVIGTELVTLQWDWARRTRGGPQVADPYALRTNASIVDVDGCPLGLSRRAVCLMSTIHQLPWRDFIDWE